MRIWPNYEKKNTAIDELSLNEIDLMIEALISLRDEGKEIQQNYKEAVAKYESSGQNGVGPMGFYPSSKPFLARKKIDVFNHWTHEIESVTFSTKSASQLNDIVFESDRALYKKSISEMSDTYTERTISGGVITSGVERVNLAKASYVIEDPKSISSDNYCSVNFENWYPCGGVFVTKAIGHYFIGENNISGISIKEISKTFYEAFVEEFQTK